ncbi:hypothetical protein NHX12_007691 [Muraenolepis orangiensis]|uniref:BTB domain-containing protein n=1 Tax=Muraenolepis orangiensis TaxID=630683 RepID=A0A9Q0DNC3_9TELE|nr:hypothetical protein NHX12_007691 [Muraenolepis orangiensis]
MDPQSLREDLRMFQSTLLQDGLKELLNENKLIDCVLKAGDRSFPCHRLILAACSPYFRELCFSEDGAGDDGKKEVVLEDVDPTTAEMIVKYVYSAEVDIHDGNVQDVLAAAHRLQIPSLFTVCVNYLQKGLSRDNCLALFRLGLALGCPRLAVAARERVAAHFDTLARGDDFLELGAHELLAVIGADSLNVETEETVFESLMRWVRRDRDGRAKTLGEAFDCVRFRLLPETYFKEKVEKDDIVGADPELLKKIKVIKDAFGGKLPEQKKKTKKEGEEEEEEEEEGGEESKLPGFLNDRRRVGMYAKDLLLMVNDAVAVAYDGAENECFLAASAEQVPRNHVSLATSGNALYILGGLFVDEENKEAPLQCYFYQLDSVCGEWTALPPMPSPRCLFSMGEVEDLVLAVAGKDLQTDQSLDTVMCYDTAKMNWSETKKLPLKLHGHSMVSQNGLVYCIGGKTDQNEALSKMFAYNHKKREWKEVSSMRTPRSMFGAAVHRGQIVVAGGVNQDGLTAACEAYDFGTNKWESFPDFPQERSSINLVSCGGQLYAVGGFTLVEAEDKECSPREITDIWQYEEDTKVWTGMIQDLGFAVGASCVSMRLNTAKMPKL